MPKYWISKLKLKPNDFSCPFPVAPNPVSNGILSTMAFVAQRQLLGEEEGRKDLHLLTGGRKFNPISWSNQFVVYTWWCFLETSVITFLVVSFLPISLDDMTISCIFLCTKVIYYFTEKDQYDKILKLLLIIIRPPFYNEVDA